MRVARAVMLTHHKRRATTTGGLATRRPEGRLFRPLGASRTLGDASGIAVASPPAEETGNPILGLMYSS